MNPFSGFLQRRVNNNVHAVVQTSPAAPSHKHSQGIPRPPHTSTIATTDSQTEIDVHNLTANTIPPASTATKPRNNPQAILSELDNTPSCASYDSDDTTSTDAGSARLSRHSIHSMPLSEPHPVKDGPHRLPLWRQSSLPTVHMAIDSTNVTTRSERSSLDGRATILTPSSADAVRATTMISHPRALHLRHTRSSSLPSAIRPSAFVKPVSADAPQAPLSSTFNIPVEALAAEKDEDSDKDDGEDNEDEAEEEAEEDSDQQDGSEMEEVAQGISTIPPSVSINKAAITPALVKEIHLAAPQQAPISPPPSPTLHAIASRRDSSEPAVSSVPTPPSVPQENFITASPVKAAIELPPSPPSSPMATPVVTVTSTLPSASPPPPAVGARASATAFLSSWHGRSRAMMPTIPRPSPLMTFQAARSVVHSVTSVGTGLIPSKEQLGSIPVAGRILNHPVMDSTLSYIATKASERGISLHALTGGVDPKKLIQPEDVPYRKLNKKLIHQAMTLSVLALQKEELSKTIDDEAGDDAFELYLAAINTLLHALPFETCDPLRREAFETQLRDFVDDQLEQCSADDSDNSKRLRRRRRRRHRQHFDQSTLLIQQQTSLVPDLQLQTQKRAQRVLKRNQQAKLQQQLQQQQQALRKQQKQQQEEKEKQKAAVDRKASKGTATTSPSSEFAGLSSHPHTSKVTKRSSRSRRHRRAHHHLHESEGQYDMANSNNSGNPGGLGDTIISTAVHSAIRLKQSPIPDVVKSCLRTSRTIFNKVDERFHLQDKAWELSKHSIEKAIELDEQYAIHEAVTETVFATLTGLVKAGIAYKETPGYASARAAAAAAAAVEASSGPRSCNPQEGQAKTQSRKNKQLESKGKDSKQGMAERDLKKAMKAESASKTRRRAVEVETDSHSSDSEDDQKDGDEDYDERASERGTPSTSLSFHSSMSSSSSSSSSTSSAYVESEDESEQDEEEDEPIELNRDTLRSTFTRRGGYGSETSRMPPPPPYSEQVREKIDMFMALKGAASLFVGSM
ncbi:hypothetical protein KVV02_004096 [Mortierella alpina]|uniref:Uncharacterized protein n=1 Tax=Mortierella alpina TaxID=64518 RepID=A0A9P8A5B7_MORAP|nr:hypothetical protein KVV02_004096 [Mortierella alpina]